MGRSKTWTPERIEALAAELLEWMNKPNNFWLKQFATLNGFHSQRFTEWAEENVVFADALKIAKEIQEYKLLVLALDKRRNPAGAIFALKNVAGWRDKVEHSDAPPQEDLPVDPHRALKEELAKHNITLVPAGNGAKGNGRSKNRNARPSRPLASSSGRLDGGAPPSAN